MFTKKLKDHFYSFKGWKTTRKIVVIESDDWGGIRTQSKKVLDNLSEENIDKNFINRYDSLENKDDLTALYECLNRHKDHKGNVAILTANFVMSNPDFEKIRENSFSQYYYEPFTDSYKKYYNTDEPEKLVTEGVNAGYFFPQFHGREHVQCEFWMRDLEAGNPKTLKGFDNNFFCFGKNDLKGSGYLSSFNTIESSDIDAVKIRIKEGLEMFRKQFNFHSLSVIPPQNTMHYSLLPYFKEQGVDFIQGARVRKQAKLFAGDEDKIKRFTGVNNNGQIDIVRNVVFEPSSAPGDWTDKCLDEIKIAFMWNKPAVICSHRFNYIGSLDEDNRKNSLNQLDILLKKILHKWPETEFLNTAELGELIKVSSNKKI